MILSVILGLVIWHLGTTKYSSTLSRFPRYLLPLVILCVLFLISFLSALPILLVQVSTDVWYTRNSPILSLLSFPLIVTHDIPGPTTCFVPPYSSISILSIDLWSFGGWETYYFMGFLIFCFNSLSLFSAIFILRSRRTSVSSN